MPWARDEGLDLEEFPGRQDLPALRGRGGRIEAVHERPDLRDGEAHLLGGCYEREPGQRVGAVAAASAHPPGRGKQAHALVVADRRWAQPGAARDGGDGQVSGTTSPIVRRVRKWSRSSSCAVQHRPPRLLRRRSNAHPAPTA
jgi:hypothetical protein